MELANLWDLMYNFIIYKYSILYFAKFFIYQIFMETVFFLLLHFIAGQRLVENTIMKSTVNLI